MNNLREINLAPQDIFTALTSLQQAAAQLRSQNDPRAIFAEVYAVITRRVAEEISRGPQSMFYEPNWVSYLAGRFAERYFASLHASLLHAPQPSQAWHLAYLYAAQGNTLPVQDALLGINAHINFDLAQGIYDNIMAHGFVAGTFESERMLARYRHDHDAVNEILKAAIPECLGRLAEHYDCPATGLVMRNRWVCAALQRLTLSVLKSWRDHVWNDVLALLTKQTPKAQAAILTRMDKDSAAIARTIGFGSWLWGLSKGQSTLALQPHFST